MNEPNPDMLLLARESRGMSQTDLAAASKLSQAKISRMEDTYLPMTPDDVQRFATALKYPTTFFYRRDIPRGAFNGLYRKRKTMPTKVLTRFNAQVLIRTGRIDRLSRKLDAVKCDLPECHPDDYDGGPAEIAAHIRQFFKMPPGPVKNLFDLLENNGVVIIREPLGSSKLDGVSIFTPSGRPVIFINSETPLSRQIFTATHELSHMVMHRMPRPEEIVEPEGDSFTAEFLMPAIDIRPEFVAIGRINLDALQRLKLRWNVSMAALVRRARDLGVIDATRYKSLVVMMSQRGYRKTEPFEEYIKAGEPSFEREMIEYHKTDLGYSDAELADTLDLTDEQFRLSNSLNPNPFTVVK